MPISPSLRSLTQLAVAVFALASLALGCGREHAAEPQADSNTNWLRACTDRDDCVAGFECVCGQCTQPCAADACPGGLACISRQVWESSTQCAAPALPYCGEACADATDCPDDRVCSAGLCVAREVAAADASVAEPPSEARDAGLPDVVRGLAAEAWTPPGNALFESCQGEFASYLDCANSDGGSSRVTERFLLELRDDGTLHGRALDSGPQSVLDILELGRWTLARSVLSLQVDTTGAAEVGFPASEYLGTRSNDGCYEGMNPSSPLPARFRVCSR